MRYIIVTISKFQKRRTWSPSDIAMHACLATHLMLKLHWLPTQDYNMVVCKCSWYPSYFKIYPQFSFFTTKDGMWWMIEFVHDWSISFKICIICHCHCNDHLTDLQKGGHINAWHTVCQIVDRLPKSKIIWQKAGRMASLLLIFHFLQLMLYFCFVLFNFTM